MSRTGKVGVSVFAVVTFVLIIFFFSASVGSKDSLSGSKNSYAISQDIVPTPLPDKLDFCGERVPLEYFDVRESLDRELQVNTYWHSQTILLLKKASRYFPVIEPILEKNGIPNDFKYMAVAESGLSQTVSPSNAVGMWQLLEGTAKQYGLEVNSEIDERYHVEKSTEAACRYLLKAHERFGNWTMTAAAYNFGQNGIDRQIDRQQGDSYYNMVLGEEAGRYVYRLLALKVIFENPDKYGFNLSKSDLYPPLRYYEVKVDTSISNIASFAVKFDTNYKLLKIFNPWLRDNYLRNPKGKEYVIKIPNKGFRENAYSINSDSI